MSGLKAAFGVFTAVLMLTAGFFLGTQLEVNDLLGKEKTDFPDGECTPLKVHGETRDKIDLLLVAKDYESDENIRKDFSYFMDFEGDNRGLFAIYPFNETMERFNIWVLDARGIADYNDPREERGLIKDSRQKFEKCGFADYKAVLSKEDMGRRAFAHPQNKALYVHEVTEKRLNDRGAAGFLHEWGHTFAGLKDEYTRENGADSWGRPNCADNRSQAEKWWGDLASQRGNVGYYNGCSYQWSNIKPHPNNTIMGGGKWSYGPVNNRAIWKELEKYG